MINRDDWGHSYSVVRSEILGLTKQEVAKIWREIKKNCKTQEA